MKTRINALQENQNEIASVIPPSERSCTPIAKTLAKANSSSRGTKRSQLVLLNLLVVMALINSLLLISSCGGGVDNTPTLSASDAVKAKLIAATSWKMQTATVDGIDQTATYKGLALSFSASGYNSTNGGIVWPASGTWSFNNTDGTSVKRDDGLIITVEVTDTSLKLAYTWTKTTLGGRIDSVKGAQVLTFTK
jgi:hypothetical protein